MRASVPVTLLLWATALVAIAMLSYAHFYGFRGHNPGKANGKTNEPKAGAPTHSHFHARFAVRDEEPRGYSYPPPPPNPGYGGPPSSLSASSSVWVTAISSADAIRGSAAPSLSSGTGYSPSTSSIIGLNTSVLLSTASSSTPLTSVVTTMTSSFVTTVSRVTTLVSFLNSTRPTRTGQPVPSSLASNSTLSTNGPRSGSGSLGTTSFLTSSTAPSAHPTDGGLPSSSLLSTMYSNSSTLTPPSINITMSSPSSAPFPQSNSTGPAGVSNGHVLTSTAPRTTEGALPIFGSSTSVSNPNPISNVSISPGPTAGTGYPLTSLNLTITPTATAISSWLPVRGSSSSAPPNGTAISGWLPVRGSSSSAPFPASNLSSVPGPTIGTIVLPTVSSLGTGMGSAASTATPPFPASNITFSPSATGLPASVSASTLLPQSNTTCASGATGTSKGAVVPTALSSPSSLPCSTHLMSGTLSGTPTLPGAPRNTTSAFWTFSTLPVEGTLTPSPALSPTPSELTSAIETFSVLPINATISATLPSTSGSRPNSTAPCNSTEAVKPTTLLSTSPWLNGSTPCSAFSSNGTIQGTAPITSLRLVSTTMTASGVLSSPPMSSEAGGYSLTTRFQALESLSPTASPAGAESDATSSVESSASSKPSSSGSGYGTRTTVFESTASLSSPEGPEYYSSTTGSAIATSSASADLPITFSTETTSAASSSATPSSLSGHVDADPFGLLTADPKGKDKGLHGRRRLFRERLWPRVKGRLSALNREAEKDGKKTKRHG